MYIAEPQTPESCQSFGSLQAETEVASGLRILRVHPTERDGKISKWLSRNHHEATHVANSTGCRVLSSVRLRAQRREA